MSVFDRLDAALAERDYLLTEIQASAQEALKAIAQFRFRTHFWVATGE